MASVTLLPPALCPTKMPREIVNIYRNAHVTHRFQSLVFYYIYIEMKKNEKLTQNIEIEITEYSTCTIGFTCSWSGKEVMKSVRGDYAVRTRRPGRVRKDQLRHRHGRGR